MGFKRGNIGCPCCCPGHICVVVIGCNKLKIGGVAITIKQGGTTIATGTSSATAAVCLETPSTGTFEVSIGSVSGYADADPQTVTIVHTCGTANAVFNLVPNAPRNVCFRVCGCNTGIPYAGFGPSPPCLIGGWILDDCTVVPACRYGVPPGSTIVGNLIPYPNPFGPGNVLEGSTVTMSTGPSGTTDADGVWCTTIAGPFSATVNVEAPYGYIAVCFPVESNGCGDLWFDVILRPDADHWCCGGIVLPKEIEVSAGDQSAIAVHEQNTEGWTVCFPEYPTDLNPECVPGDQYSDQRAVEGTTPVRVSIGCTRDQYGHVVGFTVSDIWPFERFSPYGSWGSIGGTYYFNDCRSYHLNHPFGYATCGWGLPVLPLPNCTSCLSGGTCPFVIGSGGAATTFVPIGSVTLHPFDLTAAMPTTSTVGGLCTDGSGANPNPIQGNVTASE